MLSTGQHTLTTQPDADDSLKYCILVKLTDSSAKAIEEYLKNKDNTAKKPSIMFHKDKGEICFPIESNPKQNNSSNINNSSNDSSLFRHKKFIFSLSSVKESNKDTSASFECISYANSKLKTMGSIENKLSVHAINDEVFQATKERVTSVVEAEKNNSTIEIKPSGAIVSRSGSAAANFNGQNNIRNKQNNLTQNPTPKLNTSASSGLPDTSKPKSLVTDKSLKERVIHILAIKPYKKPEIFLKLNKDSPLNEKEKEILETTLQSVATMNPKNNQFDLLNDVMLNEVKEDWPAYNQNDKQTIKRNIAKAKQSIGNTSLNNSLNTSLNAATRPSLSTSMNKPSLSPVVQPKNVSPTKSENMIKMPFHNGNNSFTNLKSKYPSQSPSGETENHHDFSNRKAMDQDFDLQSNKRLKPTTNGVITVKPIDHTNKFNNEFSKKYRLIESSTQFKEYKGDFDANYKEYKDLYDYLMPISKKFENYRLEMESLTDHSSKEYIDKKRKIFQDFQTKNSDTDYCKKRERYEYLDSKLNFLNDLFEKYSNSSTIGF